MRTKNIKSKRTPFLPEKLSAFLKKLGVKIVGVFLIILGMAMLASLFSYLPSNPSFNTATAEKATNLCGYVGAVIADLIWQNMGFAGVLLAIAPIVWGIWVVFKICPRIKLIRFVALILAIPLLCIGFAGLKLPAFWPVVAGAEGAFGQFLFDALLGKFLSFIKESADLVLWANSLMVAVSLLVGLWLTFFAFNFSLLAGIKSVSVMTFKAVIWLYHKIFRKNQIDEEQKLKKEPTIGENIEKSPEKKSQSSKTKAIAKVGENRQGFFLPSIEFLTKPKDTSQKVSQNILKEKARKLESVLKDFGIEGEIVDFLPGPVVTLYELNPASGIKSSRIISLADDIARSMSAVSVRIAVIPGKSYLGIELPNENREMVYLRELLDTPNFKNSSQKLSMALGKDIGGIPYFADLVTMPHLLVAGTTGSGKSVAVNTMILSLLYRLTPKQCRLIMIDPKMLELSVYDGIPHLLTPVVTESKKAVVALKWAVREMENRYRAMSQMAVRGIDGYNKKIEEKLASGEALVRKVQVGFDDKGVPIMEEQPLNLAPLPHIVVIVDEMADLMLVAGKEVEAAIQRLAQMARAAGIHLIMATQRPSVDVITGTIKANFPSRISFQVSSKIDSRTILDEQGAEQLLGKGDMLFIEAGRSRKPERVHGAFVSDAEVEKVVSFLKSQGEPEYLDAITEEDDSSLSSGFDMGEEGGDLYYQAVNIVKNDRKISISYLQRQLKIGYNRAADIVERMEKEGLVSEPNHVGKREILIPE